MKTVAILLLFFLAVAIFAGTNERKARLILSAGIIVAILYLYIA